MNETEIQDKIKFLIDEKGAYKLNGILTFHLSPIPNWYSMIDGGEITCPVCEKHILTVKYPKPFNEIIKVGNTLYAHRMLEHICPECETKWRFENYD